MKLSLDDWNLGYSQIVEDCRSNELGITGTVLLLCHADVDAMAAAKILAHCFQADGISYQLLPVCSFSQMQSTLQKHAMKDTATDTNEEEEEEETSNVRSIVLLNLGASRNLTRLFEQGLSNTVKIFCMDCRRPVHLANVHDADNVVVFWDNVLQENDIPSDGDNLSGNESSSSEEEDDDDEEEDSLEGENELHDDDEGEHEFGEEEQEEKDQGDVDEENKPHDSNATTLDVGQDQDSDYDGDRDDDPPVKSKKRRTLTEAEQVDDSDASISKPAEDSSQAEATQTETEDSASQPMQQPTLTPRELYHDRRNRLRSYYSSGTFYGTPAAYVAYRIANQLRFGEIGDLLWLACVGVTDAYLHARLDVAGYAYLSMDLRTNCLRLFPNDTYHRVESAVYAEQLTRAGRNADPNTTTQGLTKIGFSQNGRILCDSEFHFFLLRHTSLYNAMVYSDFMNTRLQLYTNRGMHRLQEMLAKMGFPLEECRQPYAFMKPGLRRRLQDEIRQHAEEYGLENFEFTSFFRVTGYHSLLSACDTSYAVTALLTWERSAGADDAEDVDDNDEEALMQAFNHAYDALSANEAPQVNLLGSTGEGTSLASLVNGGTLTGSTGIGAGIGLAMSLQQAIMSNAISLIESNAITRLNFFRYAYITCTSQSENQGPGDDLVRAVEGEKEEKTHIFAKPLVLTRLAHYLMDLHRENGKWTGNKARPLILLAEKPSTKSYMVVGYEYPESRGHFVKNRFGKNFELAAQSMKGTFKFDSFDSNVIEVDARDVQKFLEQLHYLMETAAS